MRPFSPFWIVLLAPPAGLLAAQARPGLPREILSAEDRRAPSARELDLLLEGLASRDSRILIGAVRAVGRLERPELAGRLLPLLGHPLPAVRSGAVEAVAQAAQGFRGDTSLAGRGSGWPAIVRALEQRAALEENPEVLGMVALSLGRLPYRSADEVSTAGGRLVALSRRVTGSEDALLDVSRGMGMLAIAAARRAPLDTVLRAGLQKLAVRAGGDPRVRRRALAGLLSLHAVDSATREAAARSSDRETRRLAALAGARLTEDSEPPVRLEGLRALARSGGVNACERLRRATDDSAAPVALAGIDLLGTTCGGDSLTIRVLGALAAQQEGDWHRRAHAVVAMARAAPARAGESLATAAQASPWELRMYAARAAALIRDTATLRRLTDDSMPNVREAAVSGLHEVVAHGGDALYRAALAARDYQLVLTAAGALAGSPERGAATPMLLEALSRITAERRETSRDPRIALLTRLHELGDSSLAPRVTPYLSDFDPVVAESAAVMLSSWTGRAEPAAPRRLEPPAVSPGELGALRGKLLRFVMAGGEHFDVELLVDEAPLTVARIARLVRQGYYDGLTFHRVVANFVIQGGSPGRNEYAGDSLFVRDELGSRSHERGTLGMSTRGRDTGDGQLFVNLVDNPRLDYEYTVWGRVVWGMPVVDVIEEGDTIRRVEIRSR